MNAYSVILLINVIIFSTLLAGLLREKRAQLHRVFSVYLLLAMAWSLAALLAFLDLWGFVRVWGAFAAIIGLLTVVAYYHFVRFFVCGSSNIAAKLGFAIILAIFVPLAVLGYIPRSISVLNGAIDIDYGIFLYLMTAVGAIFFTLSVLTLVQGYRRTSDPLNRNRLLYLLIGLGILLACSVRTAIPPLPQYPFEHIGHLGNALLISYAIMKYRLLDVKLVVRKGIVYSLISIFITATYLIMLYGLHYFLRDWNSSASMTAVFVMALFMAWLFNPLRTAIQKVVDRMFYGESYDYRQMVLNFAQRMSSVLDLSELAEEMLGPITRAVGAAQAILLLPDDEGDFISQFTKRLTQEEVASSPSMKLSKGSPTAKWLAEKNRPLLRELMHTIPELKGLAEEEQKILAGHQIELLCPIKTKNNLVGILALGPKQSGSAYSTDDMDLLVTLANEAGVVIENAQLYAHARERAHTDELTGLFNHRYFHERLDEEISRCSRFGDIFSLLFLDIDLFKAYNDIYGHLAGDEMLKKIGQYVRSSIRAIDMAFRYGGDEFTVILPQASLEDAKKVGERIRKRLETEMDSEGTPLTFSIGIASWPTDGVMREEIIQSADAALYYAKQMGRNRICLASEVIPSEVLVAARTEKEPGVLSTIYALAATVDAKDHYTYGHSKKVAKYAAQIAEALGYSEERIATLRAAALLHDIGKIGISDRLLTKVGPLTEEDWEPIRSHPKLGVAILKHVESLSGCLAAIQYHHERYDGNGYPAGLKGENIPLDARIMAVADSYDAMTSLRPYRQGKMSHEQAIEELKRCAGTQFDPKVVEAFISVSERALGKKMRTQV
jgi:diguanylate cyclase (GGDEF)-like protein/putative nucleotidyltransferase with HDIG domain